MNEAAKQEAVPEQVQPEVPMTPEQVEDALYAEAAALLEAEEKGEAPPQAEEETQADPAVGAVAEDPPETTGGEAQQPETAPPDPFADATPEQNQAWQNLVAEKARYEHDSLSNRNRVSALQKKINELEAKLEEKPPAEPDKAEKPAELPETETGVDLSEFKEDFPEIYKAVGAMYQNQVGKMQAQFDEKLGQLTQQVESVAQPVEQMRETEESRYRQHQLQALDAVHPDWKQIQETQEFWGWVEAQTDGIKALAGSVVADDNIALLNLYKSQSGIQPSAPTPPQAAAPAKPVRQPDVAIPRVNSGGRPTPGIAPQDGEKALDYWLEHWDEL
jgi:BMFP domain-containing protein YqiC